MNDETVHFLIDIENLRLVDLLPISAKGFGLLEQLECNSVLKVTYRSVIQMFEQDLSLTCMENWPKSLETVTDVI